MGNLIPGETLIYERVGSRVYARYAGRPDIPRWCINGEEAPAILSYNEWKCVFKMADRNPIFKKELDKVINLYYLLKTNEEDT